MTQALSWDGHDGGLDGLQLFYISSRAYNFPPYTLHTSLPVGGRRWNSYGGRSVALDNIASAEAAQAKAQEVLERFVTTLEDGVIDWRSEGNLLRPAVGVVGGMNLFRIYRLPERTLLRSRLPLAPGGVAQGDLASVREAKVKAEQMLDQFADLVGIDFSNNI